MEKFLGLKNNRLEATLGLTRAKFLLCVAVAMVANQSPWPWEGGVRSKWILRS